VDQEIDDLVQALRVLPGVGIKSARRMALHLLERNRPGAIRLALALQVAVDRVGHCEICRTLTTASVCPICADEGREDDVICVVETPGDVLAILKATGFKGKFHVLLGLLSPIDGIGPKELGLDRLQERIRQTPVRELILAMASSVEGDVTAHYLGEMAAAENVRATRIARGIPSGGELEYLDAGTLHHAFSGRRVLE
jgi:recombination protein RecR